MAAVTTSEAGIFDTIRQAYYGRPQICTPCIRVLISHDECQACLEVYGKYTIVDPCTNRVLARRVHGKRRPVQAERTGIRWGEEFPDVYQIKLVPTDCHTCILVNDIPYHGSISIYDVGGTISIVNEVDIEDFVTAAVAAKLDRPIAAEALNAVVIAQRTDSYYRSTYPRNPFWDVDGCSFGYRGRETLPQSLAVQHAVSATRYMVMSRGKEGESQYVHLFPAKWRLSDRGYDPAVDGPQLIVIQSEKQADQGLNAAAILQNVWPRVTIERMCQVPCR